MPKKTDYLIKCRCGAFVPLLRYELSGGELGRFYYNHKGTRNACTQYDQFPTDIDNIEDLQEMCEAVEVKPVETGQKPSAKSARKPSEKSLENSPDPEPRPAPKSKPSDTPDFNHKAITEDASQAVEVEPVVEPVAAKEEEVSGYGLADW